jgi:hypothetical protein
MATGPGVNQGKTAFVEEFLSGNPDAAFATVNEAWKSAGNEGTVSESLVGKTRSKLKLTGKKGSNGASSEAKTGSAARGKSPERIKGKGASEADEALSPPKSREGGTGSSKSAFVEAMLKQDPKANVKAINRAWTAAGNEGTISDTVVYKTKRVLGGTGRGSSSVSASAGASKPETPQTRAKPERAESPFEETSTQTKAEHASPKTTATMASRGSGHGRVLHEIEGEIDELLFRLKSLGGFTEVQDALRTARRLLVRSHGE